MGTFERIELSRNRIEVNIEAIDPNISVRSGLRYYLDIFVPDGYLSITYKKLITLEASEVPPYDQAGITIFEGAYFSIEKYLDSFLNYLLPDFGQDYISVADKLTMPYRLTKRRVNGDVVIDETSVTDKYVLKAGIDENDYLNWRDVLFSDTIAGLGGKFLTWERGKRKIRPGQQVYLYFLLNHSVTPEKLNIIAEYDGATHTFFGDTDVAGGFGVYCIPVSTDVFQLDELAAEISTFSVWVADESMIRISEIADFEIDSSYLRNERYILYSNGLGGFDSLLCKGSSSESLIVVREESERYLPFLSTASYSERVINEVTGERELRISFGLLSDDELDKLRELMYAKEIYLQGEREFLPLKLTDEALVYSESDIYVRGRTFVFRYANRQRNFSRLGAAPETALRDTAWRGFGAVNCLQNSRGIFTGNGVFAKLEKYYLDDNSAVIPAQIKSNVIGTEGYIGAVPTSLCSVTPFLSDAIARSIIFARNNCAENFIGSHPVISIAANEYGSTISKADANAKAEAAWALRNNQATANELGTCTITPWWNDAISRASTFRKNDCGVNQIGNYPIITIAANLFGSVIDKAAANAKAEIAWAALNTQAKANELGVCSVALVDGVMGYFWKMNQFTYPDYNRPHDLERSTDTIDFITSENQFIQGYSADNWNYWEGYFAAKWIGKIKAPRTGIIKFKVNHDEGCYVAINGEVLLDNMTYGTHTSFFEMAMTNGEYYDIEVRYFEANIAGQIKFMWETAAGSNEFAVVDELYR